ncbi:MAG: 16S rRNA (adenine(1518)-N(6)/adenine(1519)-N(6))-dimethyltransferase RsmA [Lachnospiraceae bacterium]|nr:16S rRNA (adenine(1518)-N(6)/adenine(1519)-N(6))-dimethyltransferase RsmA [Lachnospiraceae bacterium]
MTERISSPSRTMEIIKKYGFDFKKGYGQNFLIDYNILTGIAESAGVSKDDCVLEIGPGIGSLTQVLAENSKKVIAVEIDNKLIPILADTLGDYENIKVINQDILKTNIDALINEECDGKPIKVVANLPYYITTPIILGLLEKQYKIESITVMIQKEVAERISATEKSKDYGALSIAVQYYCDVNYDFTVSAGCFIPQPKVDSSVITLTPTKEKKYKTNNEKLFFKIVKCSFGQRRKTLVNSIANQSGLAISKEQIASVLEGMGLDARVRGEALSITQFCELADRIEKMI